MNTFEYKAYDSAGAPCRGLIEADGLKDARARLASRGFFAEQLTPAGAHAGASSGRGVFRKPALRSAVYRELASMLRAGLPLVRALDLLIESPEMDACRGLLAGIRDRVKEGENPASALAEAGRLTPFEKAILDAGRRAGDFHAGLDRAADHLEEGIRIRDRILSVSVYPLVVGGLALVIAFFLLGYMLPSFSRDWVDAGVRLPALTRSLLALGRTIRWGIPVALAVAALLFLGLRRSDWMSRVRGAADRRSFRMPAVGTARSALVSLRFARTLHLLLEAGMPLIEALELAGRSSGSAWIEARIRAETESVRHGDRLSAVLRRVPPLAIHLAGWVEAGEAGGELSVMLDTAARRASDTWNRLLQRSMSFVEPLLFLVLGVFVFLIALAVILPILALNRGMGL